MMKRFKRKKGEKEFKDRNIEIVTSYINGECLTYEELGKKYKITRERVRQIINKYLEPYQLEEIKKENSKKRTAIVIQNSIGGKCKYCGKPKKKKRVYCSVECFINDIRISPEAQKEKRRGYVHKYIHNNKDVIYLKNRIYYYKKRIKKIDYNDDKTNDYIKNISELTKKLINAKKRKGIKK